MTSAHEYCLKQKGKDLNTFVCSICESNNNIYYEIFYNIVYYNRFHIFIKLYRL